MKRLILCLSLLAALMCGGMDELVAMKKGSRRIAMVDYVPTDDIDTLIKDKSRKKEDYYVPLLTLVRMEEFRYFEESLHKIHTYDAEFCKSVINFQSRDGQNDFLILEVLKALELDVEATVVDTIIAYGANLSVYSHDDYTALGIAFLHYSALVPQRREKPAEFVRSKQVLLSVIHAMPSAHFRISSNAADSPVPLLALITRDAQPEDLDLLYSFLVHPGMDTSNLACLDRRELAATNPDIITAVKNVCLLINMKKNGIALDTTFSHALHTAIHVADFDLIDWLIRQNASFFNVLDEQGRYPLDLAYDYTMQPAHHAVMNRRTYVFSILQQRFFELSNDPIVQCSQKREVIDCLIHNAESFHAHSQEWLFRCIEAECASLTPEFSEGLAIIRKRDAAVAAAKKKADKDARYQEHLEREAEAKARKAQRLVVEEEKKRAAQAERLARAEQQRQEAAAAAERTAEEKMMRDLVLQASEKAVMQSEHAALQKRRDAELKKQRELEVARADRRRLQALAAEQERLAAERLAAEAAERQRLADEQERKAREAKTEANRVKKAAKRQAERDQREQAAQRVLQEQRMQEIRRQQAEQEQQRQALELAPKKLEQTEQKQDMPARQPVVVLAPVPVDADKVPLGATVVTAAATPRTYWRHNPYGDYGKSVRDAEACYHKLIYEIELLDLSLQEGTVVDFMNHEKVSDCINRIVDLLFDDLGNPLPIRQMVLSMRNQKMQCPLEFLTQTRAQAWKNVLSPTRHYYETSLQELLNPEVTRGWRWIAHRFPTDV